MSGGSPRNPCRVRKRVFFFTRHWEICVKPKEWTFSLFTFQTKFLLIPQCAKFCLAAGFHWPGVKTVRMWYVIVCVHSRSQEYLLGWKYYTSKTFQNYQSTIKVWLSLRKIFQLTKSLKSRDLVWPLFSLLKCSYLTQLSKLYLLQWKSHIRCWKFPSHSSEKNLKNSLLFSLVIISGKIYFMNTNQAVISHVNER